MVRKTSDMIHQSIFRRKKIKRNEGELWKQWPTFGAVVHERSLESRARHVKMTDLYPKNRTVTAFELWAQHVRGFQPFLKFGKPFHADKVYGIKIFTTLQRYVQVNVLSLLKVDCLTLTTHLGQVVEGVTLFENLRYFVSKYVNWRHVLSIVHWPVKTPLRALY